MGGFVDPDQAEQAARKLAANPAVAAYAGGMTEAPDVRVDGRAVHLLAFTPGKGSLLPAIVEGRAPTQPDEIALGSVAMRTLAKHVGDTVVASTASGAQPLRVVGRVIFNNTALATEEVAPGNGGIVHVQLWRRLSPPGTPIGPVSFYVRLDPAVPLLAIAAGALLVANLVAAGPGWAAARIRPAAVLRAE